MVKTGVVLIVLAAIALPLAFLAALLGFGAVAVDAFTVAKILSPILLIAGIALLVVGLNRRRSRMVA
jgi:uncharacterized membrane protein YtjA (UPF0391 family)